MIKKLFKKFFEENSYDICMVSIFLLVGIVCGIIIYFLLSNNISCDLINSVKDVFDSYSEGKLLQTGIVTNGIKINILLLICLMFFSITLIGRISMYAVTLVKGMSIGVYTCIIYAIFGAGWGSLVTFLLVILVNVVYIPVYIYLTTTLLAFNFELFNTRRENATIVCMLKTFGKVLLSFVFIFSSCILEELLSTFAFKIYANL